ncbi:hypothetical protein [Shewanella salipaludis]|uniref:Uncharacterized protein n=1 Tax=Shewanella salipaludis TaxID=2723052 RepID=A0A972FYR2_9GAMM|nr:hypothetical protein [Shewanella salipaludis]NMH65117.1 hypothetical protein [Shewanella salipaludis]
MRRVGWWYRVFLLWVAVACLSACTRTPEWTLFYYPERAELPADAVNPEAIAGYYEDLAQCRSKARGLLRLSDSGVGSYLCGERCAFSEQKRLQCRSVSQ